MATVLFQTRPSVIRRYLCAILTAKGIVPVNHSDPPFYLLYFFSCTR